MSNTSGDTHENSGSNIPEDDYTPPGTKMVPPPLQNAKRRKPATCIDVLGTLEAVIKSLSDEISGKPSFRELFETARRNITPAQAWKEAKKGLIGAHIGAFSGILSALGVEPNPQSWPDSVKKLPYSDLVKESGQRLIGMWGRLDRAGDKMRAKWGQRDFAEMTKILRQTVVLKAMLDVISASSTKTEATIGQEKSLKKQIEANQRKILILLKRNDLTLEQLMAELKSRSEVSGHTDRPR